MPLEISVPTALEPQLDFHSLDVMSREVEMKKLNIFQNIMNETLAGMVVQAVRKA